MTARSRERGSHAGRPRSYGLPFTVPGLPGLGSPGSFRHGWRSRRPLRRRAGPASAEPSGAAGARRHGPVDLAPAAAAGRSGRSGRWQRPAAPPGGRTARRPTAGEPAGRPGRSPSTCSHQATARARVTRHGRRAGRGRGAGTASPAERSFLSKKQRLAVALVVVIGVFGVGFADGFGGEGSPTPTVSGVPARLADGPLRAGGGPHRRRHRPGESAARGRLHRPRRDQLVLVHDGVTQHGDTAVATYKATVDLAQAGQQWTYTGQFGLTSKNGQWVIDWAPSVINPSLGAGDRLAVVTAYAPRAGVLDMDGQSLLAKSADLPDRRVPGQAEEPGRHGGGVQPRSPGWTSSRCSARSSPHRPATSSRCSRSTPPASGRCGRSSPRCQGLAYQQAGSSGCSTPPPRRWSARSAPRTQARCARKARPTSRA